MASKRNSGSPATSPVPTPEAAWDAASDMSRQQMTLVVDSACAVFRGVELMRKVQEKAAHQALQHYSRAADKLREASGPAQLMQIQAELMRFGLEGATQYWQQLGAAAADMQRELLECSTHMVDNGALQRMGVMGDSLPALTSGFSALFPFNGRAEAA